MLNKNELKSFENKTYLIKPCRENEKEAIENELLIDAFKIISLLPSKSNEAFLHSKPSGHERRSEEMESDSQAELGPMKEKINWDKWRMLGLNEVEEKCSRTFAKYSPATDKENYIFLSILISIVFVLAVLACLTVYLFFPRFR
jgi:hypothetical protein